MEDLVLNLVCLSILCCCCCISSTEVSPQTCSKVVLTGSFLPEKFKDSDADFNIGTALGWFSFGDITPYNAI